MAPRAYWTGQLRLSLVTIPIRLYPATSTEKRIELHQIHEPSGKRIRYQKVAPGVGVVENEAITKGFEYEKGKYVLLDQKEIDELRLEAKQTIELVRFVDQSEIDARLCCSTIATAWSYIGSDSASPPPASPGAPPSSSSTPPSRIPSM